MSAFDNFTGASKPLHPNASVPGRPFVAPEHHRCPARETVAVIAPTPRRATWPECPNCRQSATSQYVKGIGCYRCGWVEGQ